MFVLNLFHNHLLILPASKTSNIALEEKKKNKITRLIKYLMLKILRNQHQNSKGKLTKVGVGVC